MLLITNMPSEDSLRSYRLVYRPGGRAASLSMRQIAN